MAVNRHFFKIGVFTFAGLAIFVAGLFFIGLAGSLFKKPVDCVTFFNRSVQGLRVDSDVNFRGFKVGKITRIALAPVTDTAGQPVVRVTFRIDPESLAGEGEKMEDARDYLAKQAEKGLKAVLSFQGITGLGFLDLDYFAVDQKPDLDQEFLKNYVDDDHIYVPNGPGSILEISESATRIVKSLSDVDFGGISRDLKNLVRTVDGAVTDFNTARLSDDFDKTLEEIRGAAGNLNALVKDLDETFKGGARSNIGRELESTVDQLRQTLKRFDQLLASGQGNLPATLDNLRVMSENLRQLSELLKDQPSQAFFGEPPRPSRPAVRPPDRP
ncbi:MAG: MlaD family protein [Candidatus Adiutrix sp.]|jgi:ABC-type transporter Mla subunit MlaD|nr:MlaD family protein [Candidatus Adiutrix sp.]